ncbi:zinc transporter 1-like [Arapaima gigas]
MPRGSGRATLLCALGTTSCFFLLELLVSRLSDSLAVLADSIQVLSDVLSSFSALLGLRFADKVQPTQKNTFGWVRAQVLGSLVQAVFLTALRFSVILRALEHLTQPRAVGTPQLLFGVGIAGLLLKLLAVVRPHLLSCGPCRLRSSHQVEKSKAWKSERTRDLQETNKLMGYSNSTGLSSSSPKGEMPAPESTQLDDLDGHTDACFPYEDLGTSHKSAADLDLSWLSLHMLGALLSSAAVLINAIVFTFVWPPCRDGETCAQPCFSTHCSGKQHIHSILTSPCWILYLDPMLCILTAGILLYSTYPLLKESALVLLQAVPKQIDLLQLSRKMRKLEGVLSVHELHIWQLAGNRIVATAHIKCQDPDSYMDVARCVKGFFHDEGIHATTVQPEFVSVHSGSNLTQCEVPCLPQCASKLCCSPLKKKHKFKAKEDVD